MRGLCFYYIVLFSFLPIILTSDSETTPKEKPTAGCEDYNTTYPFTPPVTTPDGTKYRFGIITDLDARAKSKTEPNTWFSYLREGYLIWKEKTCTVTIEWDKSGPIKLESKIEKKGRGMELSDLVVFNGNLLSFDDHTGLIYKIDLTTNTPIPWVVLNEAKASSNGVRKKKPFKGEWATVKDHTLYVGSVGRETKSKVDGSIDYGLMWINTVTTDGKVTQVNWVKQFNALLHAVGIKYPGYMIHESGVWSEIHKRWFFLPRTLSKEAYNGDINEHKGTNVFFSADEEFSDIKVTYVGKANLTHGFSSFRFVPGTQDTIVVALKSEEVKDYVASYIMAFDITGKVLLPETRIDHYKYEGIEFI